MYFLILRYYTLNRKEENQVSKEWTGDRIDIPPKKYTNN